MPGKFHDPEQTQRSKRTHYPIRGFDPARKPESKINQAYDHDHHIESIEFIPDVVPQAQSNNFSDHFGCEHPDEDNVEDVEHLLLLFALVEAEKSQSDRVGEDEAVNEEVERNACHQRIEKAVDRVLFGSRFGVHLRMHCASLVS